jgi:hypothetical protein
MMSCSFFRTSTVSWLRIVNPKRGPDRLISFVTRGGSCWYDGCCAGICASAGAAVIVTSVVVRIVLQIMNHLCPEDTEGVRWKS